MIRELTGELEEKVKAITRLNTPNTEELVSHFIKTQRSASPSQAKTERKYAVSSRTLTTFEDF